MSPTALNRPARDPSTCADGPWPDGPRIGSVDAAGVLHDRHERVGGVDAAIAVDVAATATRPPSS